MRHSAQCAPCSTRQARPASSSAWQTPPRRAEAMVPMYWIQPRALPTRSAPGPQRRVRHHGISRTPWSGPESLAASGRKAPRRVDPMVDFVSGKNGRGQAPRPAGAQLALVMAFARDPHEAFRQHCIAPDGVEGWSAFQSAFQKLAACSLAQLFCVARCFTQGLAALSFGERRTQAWRPDHRTRHIGLHDQTGHRPALIFEHYAHAMACLAQFCPKALRCTLVRGWNQREPARTRMPTWLRKFSLPKGKLAWQDLFYPWRGPGTHRRRVQTR